MSYTFEQPVLHEGYIFISSPRIFCRDYASTVLYSGQSILQVSSPLSGWTDLGLISGVAIPVTKNIGELKLGLPKTTRLSWESERTAQVTFTYHEMHATILAHVMGMAQSNVIAMEAIVTQANSTNAVSTLTTINGTNRFVVGDKVTFWDASGDALSVEELAVSAVDATAKTVTCTGVWSTPPETGDILIAKAGTVASYSLANKTITLSAGDAARFVAGDRLVYLAKAGISGDNITGLRSATDRTYVSSVDVGGAVLNLNAGFTGTPVATDILVSYKSIEMLDPLGTITEKSLLVFFDAVVNTYQRQLAIWYPKVTAGGAFSPDFKNNENPMDGAATFIVQSSTQVVNDGTSKVVLQLPFFFD